MPLILASASPRRQELIQLLDLPWQVMTADVDESSVTDPDPAVNVILTARLKAEAVSQSAPENSIIVAADTIVVSDSEILGKPADAEDARATLRKLRGRTHQVLTGLYIINEISGQTISDVAIINVPMRDYRDHEIEDYIETGDPFDKAGSYAIQHPGFHPVATLAGCFAGVVGLPLCHLVRSLRKSGFEINTDIAAACQAHHHYQCPVFEQILA